MPPLDDEPRTWTPGEGTVPAGVRNVAWGAAMVMAGLLAVMAADCVWLVLSRLETYVLFNRGRDGDPAPFFDGYAFYVGSGILVELVVGLAVVIWLIGRVIRRASRSISADRSFL
jgi:hypothetical protein